MVWPVIHCNWRVYTEATNKITKERSLDYQRIDYKLCKKKKKKLSKKAKKYQWNLDYKTTGKCFEIWTIS